MFLLFLQAIIELKLPYFFFQLVTKRLQITFGKILVVTETGQKIMIFTPVGSYPKQISSDL